MQSDNRTFQTFPTTQPCTPFDTLASVQVRQLHEPSMKHKIIFCLALLLVIPFSNSFAIDPQITNAIPKEHGHNWEYITFPPLTPAEKMLPVFLIGFGAKNQGLRLDINTTGVLEFFKTNAISARVHRVSGEV